MKNSRQIAIVGSGIGGVTSAIFSMLPFMELTDGGRYYDLAGYYRSETEKILRRLDGQVSGPCRLSLHVIFALYLQVYERIDIQNGSLSAGELNPTPAEIRERILQIVKQAGQDGNIRRKKIAY